MTRTDIINKLIKKNNYKSYLEIGLDNPKLNYNKINCELKESVDPYLNIEILPDYKLEALTYRMTSDEFFEQNKKKYDIIFIDGLHHKEQVSKDIINSLKCLNPNGKIVVHDCLPKNELMQKVPRQTTEWTGDVWKAIPELKKQNIKYNVVNTDYGVGIIDYYRYHKKLENITIFENEYEDFVKNRNELMNVISCEEFNKIYM